MTRIKIQFIHDGGILFKVSKIKFPNGIEISTCHFLDNFKTYMIDR